MQVAALNCASARAWNKHTKDVSVRKNESVVQFRTK